MSVPVSVCLKEQACVRLQFLNDLLFEWFPYVQVGFSSLLCYLILSVFLSFSFSWWNDGFRLLTDGLLAGQWTLQWHASGRQVWTGAGFKHGGDVEGLQAERENMSDNIYTDHTHHHPFTVYQHHKGSGWGKGARGRLFKLTEVTELAKTEINVTLRQWVLGRTTQYAVRPPWMKPVTTSDGWWR